MIVKARHWIVDHDDLVREIWILFQGCKKKERKGERISVACAESVSEGWASVGCDIHVLLIDDDARTKLTIPIWY